MAAIYASGGSSGCAQAQEAGRGDQPTGLISRSVEDSRAMMRPDDGTGDAMRRLSPSLVAMLDRGFI
jgi:hypothetical protein